MANGSDPRGHRRWRKVRAQVLSEEQHCWLRFDGCTRLATTVDHLITVKEATAMGRLDLVYARDNCRAACSRCNRARSDRTIEEIRHLIGAADATPLRFFD